MGGRAGCGFGPISHTFTPGLSCYPKSPNPPKHLPGPFFGLYTNKLWYVRGRSSNIQQYSSRRKFGRFPRVEGRGGTSRPPASRRGREGSPPTRSEQNRSWCTRALPLRFLCTRGCVSQRCAHAQPIDQMSGKSPLLSGVNKQRHRI